MNKERMNTLLDMLKVNMEILEGSINQEHGPKMEATANVMRYWLKEMEEHGKAVWESKE